MAVVSIRYARALADVVFLRSLDAARAIAQVNEAADLLRSNESLRKVWENPAIPADQKRNLLDAIAARAGWSTEVHNFLAVIIDHRRVPLFADIARQLQAELDRRMGVTEAEITVARQLSPDEQRELEQTIARSTGGKSVRAHYRTEPAILGGAVVRIGSTIYDGSVKGQLAKIRESLSA
ncbi:MAG TPA: ATP synthase F1 subunit delta [Terriglobales bacterium]|nr:ATP synthase F1 subunit delta [Terriglobales bacterium]